MSTYKPIGWSNCHVRRVARKSKIDTLELITSHARSNALGKVEVTGIQPTVTKSGTQREFQVRESRQALGFMEGYSSYFSPGGRSQITGASSV
jgi:hypothetical protein